MKISKFILKLCLLIFLSQNVFAQQNQFKDERRIYLWDVTLSLKGFNGSPDIYDKVVITRGNCDTNYDQTLLPVGLVNHYETIINGKRCYFHHGHLSVPYSSSIKLFGSGHTHITKLNKIDDVIYLNPGSLGRPRDFKVGTFVVMTPNAITIFDVNFNVIDEMVI